jgi:CDGSH-type Zn-finger protein
MSESEITITVIESGPYKVSGGMTLLDHAGNPVATPEGRPFFLCRCGESANKPFCDGSHKSHDWDPTLSSS